MVCSIWEALVVGGFHENWAQYLGLMIVHSKTYTENELRFVRVR